MRKIIFLSLMVFAFVANMNAADFVFNFEDGMDDWNVPYYKEAVTVTTDEANNGLYSMKVAVGDWGNGKYDMQISSPKFPIIAGHKYEISFFIKSEGEGQVGLDFPNANLKNQYPWTGGKDLTPTSTEWIKVTYNPTTTPDGMVAVADNAEMYLRLLLGAVKDVTYYVDDVEITDLDAPAEPVFVNLVAHGTFEEYAAGGDPYPDWNAWGGSAAPTREISADGDGYEGGKALIIHSAGTSTDYSVQAKTSLTENLTVGEDYHVEAMMKSSVENGSARIQFQGGDAKYLPKDDVGTDWIKIEHDFTAESANNSLIFDLGLVSADYYIDNVIVRLKGGSGIQKPTISKSYFTNNTLYVGDAQAAKVSVYDMNGRLLKSAQNVASVDLTNLNAGMYIAKIMTGNQAQILKFVK